MSRVERRLNVVLAVAAAAILVWVGFVMLDRGSSAGGGDESSLPATTQILSGEARPAVRPSPVIRRPRELARARSRHPLRLP
jgi:hypothetical protein